MRIYLLLFGLMLFAPTVFASTTSWVLISGTSSAKIFLDVSTVERRGNTVFAWLLSDLAEGRPFKGKQFRSLKTRVEFDCQATRFRQVHATLYSGQMGAGSVLESGYVSNPWEAAVPQSVGQTNLQTVCRT